MSGSRADPAPPRHPGVGEVDHTRWSFPEPSRAISFSVADFTVEEEPLEIRLCAAGRCESLSVTMRTPTDDFDLVTGFLFTEGLLEDPADIERLVTRVPEGEHVVEVHTRQPIAIDPALRRKFLTSSSCGVCGRSLIRGLLRYAAGAVDDPVRVAPTTLLALPGRLRARQPLFDLTGGLHAAGLFDAEGKLLAGAEDIGRHNAVDKVIGARFRARTLPARGTILQVSGRASFEIVQKAAAARIPIVAAVSAASTLAIRAADHAGITLAGFVRQDTINVYTHAERVAARST